MKSFALTKRMLLAIGLVIVLLLSVSCGAGKAEMENADSSIYYDKEYDYGLTEDSYYESLNSKGEIVTGGSFEKPTEESQIDYSEKIIRNVSMSAETREFYQALAEIRGAVAFLGGYEQSVNTTGKSYNSSTTYRRTANMVLRIPSEKLDSFLNDVGDMVNVISQSTDTTNVTTQYYDIQSRIGVLQSEKAAYEEMLKKSDDVEYLLKIKDRLYDVIEEIESYETQLRMYDSKVAYSTVSVRLEEVIEYSTVTTPKDTFGTRIGNAFTESWRDFADGFQSFVVWFVYALPTLLILAAIGTAVVALVIATSRRAAKRAKEKNDKSL